jgi:phosphohistidine phosphatase
MPSPAPDTACILVRHAHAEWPTYRGRDFDRPLTPRGLDDALATGRAIHASGIVPSLLVASSARRTEQTARILMEQLGLPVDRLRLLDSLYNAEASALHGAIEASLGEDDVVLLVAHNPGISELARLLAGADAAPSFRPAEWRVFPRWAVTPAGDTPTAR